MVALTQLWLPGIYKYLEDTGNEEFKVSIADARQDGLSDCEILISLMAKLCYKSLTLGHNSNISRVRDIRSNIESAILSEHGSVLEHADLSFIARDCSRVFTHELVRHRAGTAFSQNSGRFIRLDEIDLIVDPILEPVQDVLLETVQYLEVQYAWMAETLGMNNEGLSFDTKKKLTSALRRIAPNGQANEVGFTLNLRALRFVILKRTHRAAEWEIREIFNQVYQITKQLCPTIYCDAQEEIVNGLLEVTFKSRT